MPVYELDAPNGRTYQIQGPPGATDEQVRAAVLEQHPAAAGKLPDMTPQQAREQLKKGERVLAEQTRGMTPEQVKIARQRFESEPVVKQARKLAGKKEASFWQGVGEGLADTVGNLAYLGDVVTNPIGTGVFNAMRKAGYGVAPSPGTAGLLAERDLRQKASAASPYKGGTGGKIVGQIIGSAPLIPVGGPISGGALMGAATTEDPTNPNQMAIDMGIGAAAGKVADVAGKRLIAPAMRRISNAMRPKGVAPEAADIIEQGAKTGVRVLTTDVKPPRTFLGKTGQALGERIPIAGTGGVRRAQQAERVEATRALLREYGADDVAALGDVAADLAATRGKELSRLTRIKNGIIDNIEGTVPVNRTLAALDDQIASMKSVNPEKLAPVIRELEGWRRTIGNKSLRGLEENRKILGEAFSAPELASLKKYGEDALNPVYKALRDDMGDYIGANQGKAAQQAWMDANKQLSGMAGELKTDGLKRVLNSLDATPENVEKLLFSTKPSTVERLYANLSPGGKARAQAAVLQRAMDKAGGVENISPDKFVNEVARLGKTTGVHFGGNDLARVQGFVRLLEATKRAAVAEVAPPTGVQALPYAMGMGYTALFGPVKGALAAGGTGGIARIYESAPIRNYMVRLGQTKPGSPAEHRALAQLTRAISVQLGKEAVNDAREPEQK